MTLELEAVLFREAHHLRDDHGVPSRAPQTRQIRVVDDADRGRVAPVHQRLVEEALHREAVETAIELQIPPLRVAQVDQAGDDLDATLAANLDGVGAGVVLHLRARHIRHAIASRFSLAANAELPEPSRQRRVLDVEFLLLEQLLVHALRVPVAFVVQPLEEFSDDPDLVLADSGRHRALLGDDRSHGVARDLKPVRDLPHAHALLVQEEDRLALIRLDHGDPSTLAGRGLIG